jgi:hypothetical protein
MTAATRSELAWLLGSLAAPLRSTDIVAVILILVGLVTYNSVTHMRRSHTVGALTHVLGHIQVPKALIASWNADKREHAVSVNTINNGRYGAVNA